MQAKILITNNTTGNHPAEKWAMATAEMIADSTHQDNDAHLIEAQKLQLKFAEILKDEHQKVQDEEKAALAGDPAHIATDWLASLKADVEKILAAIIAAAKGTLWEAQFLEPSHQAFVREVVQNHLLSSMHVERLAHADRNPNCEHASAYKLAHLGGNV